ncbi:hypothetical protein [Desulfofundulus thermocisternus]|uniref:hypothetical protein n=1 Tax=Desulfofundulus thermocisternus TaxID=42471 RepID=UPI00048580E5|nr:hypothetical protein [Desulfofundulus thermocisternus]
MKLRLQSKTVLAVAVLVAAILTVFTVHAAMKTASTASKAATGAVKGAVQQIQQVQQNSTTGKQTYVLTYSGGDFPLLVDVTHSDRTSPPEHAKLNPGESFTFTAGPDDMLTVKRDINNPYQPVGQQWTCQYIIREQPDDGSFYHGVISNFNPVKECVMSELVFSIP